MSNTVLRRVVVAVFGVSAGVFSAAAAAEPVWISDWLVSGPPTLFNYPRPTPGSSEPPAADFAANGDVLLGALTLSGTDYQFVRLDANGALRWATNLHPAVTNTALQAQQATDDGGAVVAFNLGRPYSNHVVRVDASGSPIWSRDVPAARLARLGNDRVASANDACLTVLDFASGDVIWQQCLNDPSRWGNAASVAADAEGHLFATFPIYPIPQGNTAIGFRTVRFDADGNILWNVEGGSPTSGEIVGFGNGRVYERTRDDVRALDAANGVVEWAVPVTDDARVLVSADATPEPIVVAADALQRLDADTGAVLWTQAIDAPTSVAALVSGAVFVVAGTDLVKLDVQSGTIAWSSPLPLPGEASLRWLALGGSGASNVTVVGQPDDWAHPAQPPLILHYDATTGVRSDPLPMPSTAWGIAGASSAVDDRNDVIAAAPGIGASGYANRLRRLDAATGSVLWEAMDDSVIDGLSGGANSVQVGIGGDAIAVSAVVGPNQMVVVSVYDRASGTRRWRSVVGNGGRQVDVSPPALDSDGNVYVAVGALQNDSGTGVARHSLYKLSADTGDVQWHYERVAFTSYAQAFPDYFRLVDDDVVLNPEDLDGPISPGPQRLSGVDGSVVWTSDVFTGDGIFEMNVAEDGSLIAAGFQSWARLDAATGTAQWVGHVPQSGCTVRCNMYGLAILPDNDVITVGEADRSGTITRMRGDGSGLADTWRPIPPETGMRSSIVVVAPDGSGRPWVVFRRAHKTYGGDITFLARFDTNSGSLVGQQALNGDDGFDFLDLGRYFGPLKWLSDDRLLVRTSVLSSSQPSTTGLALLDTTVAATGDLGLTITTDRPAAQPGDRVGFRVVATYEGDAPISGAKLAVDLPWPSGIGGASCSTQSASNCVLDVRSGNLKATFDAQPGGRIEITGDVQVTRALMSSDPSVLTGFVYGPISLAEDDTNNNFARAEVAQSIFADGFEGRAQQ